MKKRNPCITLFGSNSGNNLGDAAILSAILESFTTELSSVEFLVPTSKPGFVNEKYGKRYNVKAVDIMPWNFSFRFFGLPTIRCLLKSDAAFICDGIIFGKRLFNPSFNLLITLFPLAILAKLCRCKLVCYSVGIGPFPRGRGGKLAKILIQSCDLIMMREEESKRLAQRLGVTKPIELTGDAAFVNPVSSEERGLEIARKCGINLKKPLLGINITGYVDSWMKDDGSQSDSNSLLEKVCETVRSARASLQEDLEPVIFSTHPMDLKVVEQLASKLEAPVVSSTEYLSHDIQAVMRMCSLFVGMRFHSLVLSSAVNVPVVGLVYAPKVKGLMEDLGCPELAVPMNQVTNSGFAKVLVDAWNRREELLERQAPVVERFRQGARRATRLVSQRYFPECIIKRDPTTAGVESRFEMPSKSRAHGKN